MRCPPPGPITTVLFLTFYWWDHLARVGWEAAACVAVVTCVPYHGTRALLTGNIPKLAGPRVYLSSPHPHHDIINELPLKQLPSHTGLPSTSAPPNPHPPHYHKRGRAWRRDKGGGGVEGAGGGAPLTRTRPLLSTSEPGRVRTVGVCLASASPGQPPPPPRLPSPPHHTTHTPPSSSATKPQTTKKPTPTKPSHRR